MPTSNSPTKPPNGSLEGVSGLPVDVTKVPLVDSNSGAAAVVVGPAGNLPKASVGVAKVLETKDGLLTPNGRCVGDPKAPGKSWFATTAGSLMLAPKGLLVDVANVGDGRRVVGSGLVGVGSFCRAGLED